MSKPLMGRVICTHRKSAQNQRGSRRCRNRRSLAHVAATMRGERKSDAKTNAANISIIVGTLPSDEFRPKLVVY